MDIDNTLHKLRMLTFKYDPFTFERRKAEETVNSLAWYISTGRASTPFCKALCNLKGNQRAALLRRMVNADYTTDAQIKAATNYIKVES